MKLLLGILLPLLGVMGIWGLANRATNVVAAQEPTETPTGEAAGETAVDPRFGVVESFWEPAEAADLQVGWDRILFLWHEIQPTGPDDWNTLHVLEEWLVDAQMNGRTVVGLLKSTPPWAADGEAYAGVPQGLYLPIDDPGNLWAVYLRRVAEILWGAGRASLDCMERARHPRRRVWARVWRLNGRLLPSGAGGLSGDEGRRSGSGDSPGRADLLA